MGKGSNVQKKKQAQERNAANKGKTDEERKAARDKSLKDAEAFKCKICLQTFMANARPPLLYEHVVAKHAGLDPVACFDSLADFDPNDPKGLNKPAATESGPPKPKPKSKKEADLDLLLDAGLKKK
ncbi:hypothetical protein MPSEU_001097700 [Mayamaea pseudoterrestris]|nr:hypothetical protein MPSEU_001097700 [Mayamaea pseudoterrestris]